MSQSNLLVRTTVFIILPTVFARQLIMYFSLPVVFYVHRIPARGGVVPLPVPDPDPDPDPVPDPGPAAVIV